MNMSMISFRANTTQPTGYAHTENKTTLALHNSLSPHKLGLGVLTDFTVMLQ